MENIDKIRKFINRFTGGKVYSDTEDIFAEGLVNSLFITQLAIFIEMEFDLELQKDDLEIRNICSVDAIVLLIETKKAGGRVIT
ncbi:MAG: natural product biosynthesis carrier protein [Anaerocolumna sp.]